MEHITEITRMEHHLNDASAALADFAAALEKLQAAQIWIHELERTSFRCRFRSSPWRSTPHC